MRGVSRDGSCIRGRVRAVGDRLWQTDTRDNPGYLLRAFNPVRAEIMKKYVIANTWNGSGYSDENRAWLYEFESDDVAEAFIRKEFETESNPERWDTVLNGGRIIEFSDGEDTGTWQWFPAPDDVFGVVILCNVNSVIVCNQTQYDYHLKEALYQADPQDKPGNYNGQQGLFVNAFGGDYDYQFVRLKDDGGSYTGKPFSFTGFRSAF